MTPGAIVTTFMQAIEAKDLEAAVALLSPDCEYDNVPIGKVHGPDGVRQTLGWLLDACGAVEWVVHHQVEHQAANGTGVVMNERLDRFELGDRWIELPVAGLFVVDDHLITVWRDYFDQPTFMSQMPGV